MCRRSTQYLSYNSGCYVSSCQMSHLWRCVMPDIPESRTKAWFRHAESNGLTSTNCQWGKLQGEFVKTNFSGKYKSSQLYDLSKRIWNALTRDLQCSQEWVDFCGEYSDFSNSEVQALPTLQNLHCWSKIVSNSLICSYPLDWLVILWMEGCKFLVASLNCSSAAHH